MKKTILVTLILCSTSCFADDLILSLGKGCSRAISDDCDTHNSALTIADRRYQRDGARFVEAGFIIDNYEKYDGMRRGFFIDYGAAKYLGPVEFSIEGGPYLNQTEVYKEYNNDPHEHDETAHNNWDIAALIGLDARVKLGHKTSVGINLSRSLFMNVVRDGTTKSITIKTGF